MEVTEHVTEQVARLLETLGNDIEPGQTIMARLGLVHRPTFLYTYVKPALEQEFLVMTLPDKPRSRGQRYQLTVKGKAWVAEKRRSP